MHVPFFISIAFTERTQARKSLHCSRWFLILGLCLCDTHNCSDVGFSTTNHSLATEAVEWVNHNNCKPDVTVVIATPFVKVTWDITWETMMWTNQHSSFRMLRVPILFGLGILTSSVLKLQSQETNEVFSLMTSRVVLILAPSIPEKMKFWNV